MKAWSIVAYVHTAEIVCRDCMRRRAAFACEAAGVNSEFKGVGDLLEAWAKADGISREDEGTYDSDDFPKVVFASDVTDDETCTVCGEEIL